MSEESPRENNQSTRKKAKLNNVTTTNVCEHAQVYMGLCAQCGLEVAKTNQIAIGPQSYHLSVSKEEAKRMDEKTTKRLLEEKKLSIILDLDHTLIHATNEQMCLKKPTANGRDTFEFRLPNDPFTYFVKYRPFLLDFLRKVSQIYELYIFTMGTRYYAVEIARILNESLGKTFFQDHQILSRDDCKGMFKDISRISPCADSMVVILDDREDVWSYRSNLITIEPYRFFKAKLELNALPGDKKPNVQNGEAEESEENGEHEDNDVALHHVLHILEDCHKVFYSSSDIFKANTKDIVRKFKSRVLRGCVLLFTHVIPQEIDPARSKEWRLAQIFGARCTQVFDDTVTHVVAGRGGTSKVHTALKKRVFLVNTNWFINSMKKWKRLDETDYPLENNPVLPPGFEPPEIQIVEETQEAEKQIIEQNAEPEVETLSEEEEEQKEEQQPELDDFDDIEDMLMKEIEDLESDSSK